MMSSEKYEKRLKNITTVSKICFILYIIGWSIAVILSLYVHFFPFTVPDTFIERIITDMLKMMFYIIGVPTVGLLVYLCYRAGFIEAKKLLEEG